jgi:hypothetical protein
VPIDAGLNGPAEFFPYVAGPLASAAAKECEISCGGRKDILRVGTGNRRKIETR